MRAATAFLMVGAAALGQDRAAEKEAALGKILAAEFSSKKTLISDPAVQSYLGDLGRRLAAQMPEMRFPFTFESIAEDPCASTHAPVAFPAGYVFVPARLFLAARNEAEFARMLAHGMAIAQQPGLSAPRDFGSIPLVFLVFPGGCSERAVPVGVQAEWKRRELEADRVADQAVAGAAIESSDQFIAARQRVRELMPAASAPPSLLRNQRR